MRRFITKRRAAVLSFVAVLALTGAAVAYFSSTGTGTGSATVGNATAFTVHGDVSSALYPAGPAVTVPITVKNNSTGAQKVGTVTLDTITADPGHLACDTSLNSTGSAFTFVNPVTIDQDLPAGATSTIVNGSLQMNDTGVLQDSCQGATLTLHFSEQNATS